MKKFIAVFVAALTLLSFAACGKNYKKYEEYIGNYNDEVSQRAYASIEIDEDLGPVFKLHWGGSAYESNDWVMAIKLEGDKLTYTSGTYYVTEFNEDGTEKSCTEEEFGEGYLEIKDGKLYFTGAHSLDLAECIFVKEEQ